MLLTRMSLLLAHRLFDIPETLDLVMESFDDADSWDERVAPLSQCARVSHFWSKVALKRLWKTSYIMHVLELLSPFVNNGDGWVRIR